MYGLACDFSEPHVRLGFVVVGVRRRLPHPSKIQPDDQGLKQVRAAQWGRLQIGIPMVAGSIPVAVAFAGLMDAACVGGDYNVLHPDL